MMSGKNSVAEVIKVGATAFTLIALAVRLGVILPAFYDLSAAAFRTANSCLPPQLAHGFVTLGIVNQTREIEVEHGDS